MLDQSTLSRAASQAPGINRPLGVDKKVNFNNTNSIENKVFGVLFCMVRNNNLDLKLYLPIVLLEDLQLFYFIWRILDEKSSPSFGFKLYDIFNPLGIHIQDFDVFVGICATYFTVLLFALACMAYTLVSFANGKFKLITPLIFLRAITTLLCTIFLIPAIETFSKGVLCTVSRNGILKLSAYSDVTCFSAAHVPIFVICALGLVLFIPFAVIMSLTYFSPSPTTGAGRRDSRSEMVYTLMRILMVLIWEGMHKKPSSLLVVFLIFLVIHSYHFLRHQSYYDMRINNLHFAFTFSATLTCLCAILIYAISDQYEAYITILVLQFLLIPVGYFLNAFYQKQRLNKIYDRFKKQQEAPPSSLPIKTTVLLGSAAAESKEFGSNTGSLYSGAKTNAKIITDIVKRREAPKENVFSCPSEVEIAARFLRVNRDDTEALILVRDLFEAGICQFPKCAGLRIFYANYVNAFWPDDAKVEASIQILKASDLNPCFDERFLIFVDNQVVQQKIKTGQHNGSQINLTSYIEYSSIEMATRKSFFETLNKGRAFWNQLRSTHTSTAADVQALMDQLKKLTESERHCSEQYRRLFMRFPKNKNSLRTYGRFLFLIKGDADAAQTYIEMADEIENQEMIEHSHQYQRPSISIQQPNTKLVHQIDAQPGVTQGHFRLSSQLNSRTDIDASITENPAEAKPSKDNDNETITSDVHSDEASIHTAIEDDKKTKSSVRQPAGLSNKIVESSEVERVRRPGVAYSESSMNSTGTRGIRQRRRLRFQLASKLKQPIDQFLERANISNFFMLALIISGFLTGITILQSLNSGVDRTNEVGIGRRQIVKIAQDVRSLVTARLSGGPYESALKMINDDTDVLSHEVTQSLRDLAHRRRVIESIRYTQNRGYDVDLVNEFDIPALFAGAVSDIIAWNSSAYENQTYRSLPAYRYVMDNTLGFALAFDIYSTELDALYEANLSFGNTVVTSLLVGLLAITSVVGLVYTNFSMKSLRDAQGDVIKMFIRIPKKVSLSMATEIEEEMESITQEDELMQDLDSNNSKEQEHATHSNKVRLALDTRYIASILLLTLTIFGTLYPFLNHTGSTGVITRILNDNIRRRTYTRVISWLADEAVESDTSTWVNGQANVALLVWNRKFEVGEDKLAEELVMFTNDPSSKGYKLLREGSSCYFSNQEDCNTITYDPSIGFTEKLFKGGLDLLIYRFMDEAKAFAQSNDYTFENKHYKLMNAILKNALVPGVSLLQDEINVYVKASTQKTTILMSVFFALSLSFLAISYYIGFRKIASEFEAQMHTLLNLVFMIPPETRSEVPEINLFLQSAHLQKE